MILGNAVFSCIIPKNQIVLAFQPADIRQYTEFAVT
ncbi:element excision factor XisI family protein [Nostoc sp.]